MPPHAVQLRAESFRLEVDAGVNASTIATPAEDVADLLGAMPAKASARFDWLRQQQADAKARLLAFATASLVNAVQGKFTEKNRLNSAERIARAAGLDMEQHWSGGVDFYDRLTRRACLAALEEARGKEAADNCAKLGKADLAKACAERIPGTGWLPQPLRLHPEAPEEAEPDIDEESSDLDIDEEEHLYEAAE